MRRLAVSVSLVFLATLGACGTNSAQVAGRAAAVGRFQSGGTLRLVIRTDAQGGLALQSDFLDPEWFANGSAEAAELLRCCLVRSLYSYRGTSTAQGGMVIHPDLAEGMPEVSSDGLTWTIRLQTGLRYAPPLASEKITAPDIVRAISRALRIPAGAPDPLFEVIEGAKQYEAGNADSISGLQTPDSRTLVIHLTHPQGDLAARLSEPDSAPIPRGVTDGHDNDYGDFLVASGPYMVEGADHIDFSRPPSQQVPASGLQAGKSLTLVRNPSWDPRTDELRAAYADRIAIQQVPTQADANAAVDAGTADVVLSGDRAPQVPSALLARYESDPILRSRVHVDSSDSVVAIIMNLAVPPFDDIHVRKAVNLVLDRADLLQLAGGAAIGQVTDHLVPDTLENNLLLGYDPYRSADHRGDLAAARAEMRQSRYDHAHGGSCDDPVCTRIAAFGRASDYFPAQAGLIAKNLAAIGLDLDVHSLPVRDLFARVLNPKSRDALYLDIAFGKDFPSASDFFTQDLSAPTGTNNTDDSLIGATPDELRGWGYTVTSVPSVDDSIQACLSLQGGAQFRCWAEADQLLMQRVVPWAAYLSENFTAIVGPHVAHYSYDQYYDRPAPDEIALHLP